ncbi:glycosyltransferase [Synechococcus sp. CS-603]|uniref:glycosyltransferase n=1 Tax=Synechococcus sp. CS-603 TaxID=2847981 RepID=UPI00223B87BC|nr:glycosyltransferase [Synechococcus sp. CS-603]MCT0201793.1 glycosyltransferase [Synechococcus sp. CS-603]
MPHQNAYSETFIANHINFLPFEKVIFTGRQIPFVIHGKSNYYRIFSLVDRILYHLGDKTHWVWRQSFSQFLKTSGIDVSLIEFGTMAVNVYKFLDCAKIPYVVHFHGFDAYHKQTVEANLKSYKIIFRNAAAIVVVSKAMKKKLHELGAPEHKVILNPYGVDPDLFSAGRPSDASTRFVAVGRFVEKKAPHLTISAFRTVVTAFPNAQLFFIGDGPLLNPCKSLVKAFGLENNIYFCGVLPPKKIWDYLQSARAFLQHSIVSEDGDSEGTPLSIIEAQMAGLPVIATNHAGIPDVVIHGETGLLGKELDIRTMANHILLLANDPQLAASMGRNARQRATKLFPLYLHISNMESIIRKAGNHPAIHERN